MQCFLLWHVWNFLQISQLLVVHPKRRLTAEKALEHNWFKEAQVHLILHNYSLSRLFSMKVLLPVIFFLASEVGSVTQ